LQRPELLDSALLSSGSLHQHGRATFSGARRSEHAGAIFGVGGPGNTPHSKEFDDLIVRAFCSQSEARFPPFCTQSSHFHGQRAGSLWPQSLPAVCTAARCELLIVGESVVEEGFLVAIPPEPATD
jgi:hypothetical protein